MIASMLNRLKARLSREKFQPSWLGVAISPVYFIRNGIYQSVRSMAPGITGDVLDFGCGSKPYESLFINASSYVGADIEVSGHDHKRSRIDVYYDGKTLPFPDRHFDAVVSFEVFEHVFNLDEVLEEIRRVLKPGGQLLITIPFAWDEHEIPYDFARYTSFGIRHVLVKSGFEVVEIQKTTTYVVAVCQMGIAYLTQHVLPKRWAPARAVGQLLFVFPLNMATLLLNAVLPKRYEYFCNSAVLGTKSKDGKV
jgi:SAM-dependent methyltransferase